MKQEAGTMDILYIKAANANRGFKFFERGSMEFFRSRVHDNVYQGSGGIYFVTSEQFESSTGERDSRRFTVRTFNPETGNVDTHGEFQAYASRSGAHKAAERLAKGSKCELCGKLALLALDENVCQSCGSELAKQEATG